MITSSKRLSGKRRSMRDFKPAASARRTRAALAFSVSVLALASSGTAMAQTCNSSGPLTVSCNGDFTTLPGGSFVPVSDLTLILGDVAPTSVTPAAGIAGVDASWGGNVGVINHGGIVAVDADAVDEHGSTSAMLLNYGNITAIGTGTAVKALQIDADGDVTVMNGGSMLAQGSGAFDVTTIVAHSNIANVSVANSATGTIAALAQDGNAIAVDASADAGTITIRNDGAITASSVNGPATAIRAEASGDIAVSNTGDISATISSSGGNYSRVSGIYEGSASGTATVTNSGDINILNNPANAYASGVGINANGVDSNVTNSGSIQVDAASAYGVVATSQGGVASITNTATGTIAVSGKNAVAVAAGNYFGTGQVDNAGSITATAAYCGAYCYTNAVGVVAPVVNNAGTITVSSGDENSFIGGAKGISARSYGTDPVAISNSGSISVDAAAYIGDATGINAGNYNGGTVNITNSGGITVTADGALARARGIATDAVGDANIVNQGDINVSAGNAAAGIFAFSEGVQRVSNSGSIETVGSSAQGIATYATTGIIDNSGSISVLANGAFGIQGNSSNGDNTITNSGDITVASNFQAHGVNEYVLAGYGVATFGNSGSINVSTTVSPGAAYVPSVIGGAAYGVNIVNQAGDIDAHNSGSISVALDSYSEFANGLGKYQTGATGLLAYGHNANISIENTGSITASSEVFSLYFGAQATGIKVTNDFGDVAVENAKAISATAVSDYFSAGSSDLAIGISVNDSRGGSTITNSSTGVITATSSALNYGTAAAIGVDDYTLTGSITVVNAGAIDASARSGATSGQGIYGQATAATGIRVTGPFSTDVSASNSSTGTIIATAQADHYGAAQAIGIDGSVYYGALTVTNAGAITASAIANGHADLGAAATATGIRVINASPVAGTIATVSNSGAITVNASADLFATAQGVTLGGLTADLTTVGAVHVAAASDAVLGTAQATGITVSGDTITANLGAGSMVTASANGQYGSAIGLSTSGNILTASNAGTITADFAGVQGNSYGVVLASYGDGHFTNTGAITSTSAAHAVGVQLSGGTDSILVNSGTITASSSALLDGNAVAIGSDNDTLAGSINVTNAGAITASARADSGDTGAATGIRAINASPVVGASATVTNSGAITANAFASLSATAQGVAVTGMTANLASVGTIQATATSDTALGTALATGITVSGDTVTANLGAGGIVTASASGHDGSAIGLSTSGDIVTASNAGTINADFAGVQGDSYGVVLASNGGGSFTNTGAIKSTSADRAVGVQLIGSAGSTLVNSGTIAAISTTSDGIVVLGDDAGDTIRNNGSLTGAIITGSGNDILNNSASGIWAVTGKSTNFGAGDDSIVNAGTISLNNSALTLGGFAVLGNSFTNSGVIRISGADRIDMGANNPNAFTNTGIVDFRNGAASDSLTVAGNWAGNGRVGVDVSGLHGKADILHIVGNVAAASTTAVDVTLLDLPTTALSSVPVIDVTGNSTATSFALGQLHFDTARSFLVVQGVGLTSNIDATNAKPDIFSVQVAVTGLTDSGALAASIVPGVQSLLGSEIGTWRQRMGVIGKTAKGHLSTWARFFQDDGTVDAGHLASNFGQEGNFAFRQKNSGEEGGVDFAVSDELSIGALGGHAQATQNLAYGGAGSTRIKGDTFGAYATWISPRGFYLDASYRRLNFHSDLNSAAGQTRTKGKADAFNLETGFDWSLGAGFKIEPQLQYTNVHVGHLDALSGALNGFTPESGTSSRGRAGVLLSKALMAGSLTVTPYVSLSAVREFDGKSRYSINDTFSGQTDTRGTSGLLESGLAVQSGKMTVTGSVNLRDGGALKSFAGGQVGLRYAW